MTTLRVCQLRRDDGRYSNQVDIYLHDRRDPGGTLYAPCANREEARKVIAAEAAAFKAAGMSVRVIAV
jgi:hypothetical protein